jgi:hypothetical protein
LILTAIAHSIRTLDLPLRLFDDLVSAFGQDTMTNRYASWADVLDYCRRSANPVGASCSASPAIATGARSIVGRLVHGLQLTNFWQDFGRDWRAGRLYVPREVCSETGATKPTAGGVIGDAWGGPRALRRGHARFVPRGRSVCDGVRGRLRAELRFTWLGGMRILERVEHGRLSLFDHRPALGAADASASGASRWTPARL